jgi:hypothetical protein
MFAVIGLTTLLAGQSNSALQNDSATLNGANFEVVGLNIATTGVDAVQKSDEPINLNFEN